MVSVHPVISQFPCKKPSLLSQRFHVQGLAICDASWVCRTGLCVSTHPGVWLSFWTNSQLEALLWTPHGLTEALVLDVTPPPEADSVFLCTPKQGLGPARCEPICIHTLGQGLKGRTLNSYNSVQGCDYHPASHRLSNEGKFLKLSEFQILFKKSSAYHAGLLRELR